MAAQAKTFTGSDEDFAALLQALGRQHAELNEQTYGMLEWGKSIKQSDFLNLWNVGGCEESTLAKMQTAIKLSYLERGYPRNMLNLPPVQIYDIPARLVPEENLPESFKRLRGMVLRNTTRGAHAPLSTLYGDGPVDPIERRKILDKDMSRIYVIASEVAEPSKKK